MDVRTPIARLLAHPTLATTLIKTLFPAWSVEAFKARIGAITTVDEFQTQIISRVVEAVLEQSSDGLSVSGADTLVPGRGYLFLSNHREILCDSALLAYHLKQNGMSTPWICLGDNLFVRPWIEDLLTLNKGLPVRRSLRHRELLNASIELSEHIRTQVTQNNESIWIAQREGRAKNGDDRTQPSLLKMLTLAGEGSIQERLDSLRIIPVTVSYEFNPCDALMARELYLLDTIGQYTKRPDEDLDSMALGAMGDKGRIHIEIGTELTGIYEKFHGSELNRRHQLERIAEAIDLEVHANYRLWPTNFIAYDLIENQATFRERYTTHLRGNFVERMERQIQKLALHPDQIEGVRRKFLESYARPVVNQGLARPSPGKTVPLSPLLPPS